MMEIGSINFLVVNLLNTHVQSTKELFVDPRCHFSVLVRARNHFHLDVLKAIFIKIHVHT